MHAKILAGFEADRLLAGCTIAAFNRTVTPARLRDIEFSVFSQFGDDGIIQWLISRVDIPTETFVEFGVADYVESNTRFLLMNNNWKGFVMDGSSSNIERIHATPWFWRHDLTAHAAFITVENINELLASAGVQGSLGLLHIDIDGVDYWVWQAIRCVVPAIVIVEYNALFGNDRAISVPYRPDFDRRRAHYSGLYAGASLLAMKHLGTKLGYSFVGTNRAANNAYFVKNELMNDDLRQLASTATVEEARFREAHDPKGRPTFLGRQEGLALIRGMPVVDVITGEHVRL